MLAAIGLRLAMAMITLAGGLQSSPSTWVSEAIAALLFMLAPYVLSLEVMHAARRFAWAGDSP